MPLLTLQYDAVCIAALHRSKLAGCKYHYFYHSSCPLRKI